MFHAICYCVSSSSKCLLKNFTVNIPFKVHLSLLMSFTSFNNCFLIYHPRAFLRNKLTKFSIIFPLFFLTKYFFGIRFSWWVQQSTFFLELTAIQVKLVVCSQCVVSAMWSKYVCMQCRVMWRGFFLRRSSFFSPCLTSS